MSSLVITSRDWNRIDKNYKCDNGEDKAILYLTPRGTSLIPVRLDDEDGMEYGAYRFNVHGAVHRVFAYTMAEALRIIRNSSRYSLKRLSALEREAPYQQREQAEIIDGRIVYIIGDRYEITDEGGNEVVLFGDCEPGITLRQVYEKHFPRATGWDRFLFVGSSAMEAKA